MTNNFLNADQIIELLQNRYHTQGFIENSAWHFQENIKDHTEKVLSQLKDIIRSNTSLINYFSENILGISKYDLLQIAVAFHDIGKVKSMVIGKNGQTSCVGHEDVSAEMTHTIMTELKYQLTQIKYVASIVKYHGKINEILGSGGDEENELQVFLEKNANIKTELVIHTLADTKNSYLKTTFPEDYAKRIKTMEKLLKGINISK